MRRALILWNAAVLAALFVALGATVRAVVAAGMYAAIDRELAARAGRLAARNPRPEAEERPARRSGRRLASPYRACRYAADGRSEIPAAGLPLWDEDAFARSRSKGVVTSTVARDDGPVRVLTVPVVADGAFVGAVQAPYPVGEVEQARGWLDRALLLLIVPVLLAAWGGARLTTDRALGPVRRLADAAGRLGAQNLSERLPTGGADEFGALAAAFNGLLGRLENAFEQQRRFTADASHELKTPLTQIKGTTSLALLGPQTPERLRGALEEVDRSADAMAALVQDLLLLARGDAGRLGANPEPVDARELLERALARTARPDGATVRVDVAPEGLTLTGNAGELLRLIVNLLDNALRHTPKDGVVTVVARPGRLVVADTGCGIAPEHLARLTERFYRIDSARSRGDGGSGLGLAICQSIVQGHGGTLAVASEPGVGTTVTISLPV